MTLVRREVDDVDVVNNTMISLLRSLLHQNNHLKCDPRIEVIAAIL